MTDPHPHPYQRVFDEIANRQPVRAILDHVRNKYGHDDDAMHKATILIAASYHGLIDPPVLPPDAIRNVLREIRLGSPPDFIEDLCEAVMAVKFSDNEEGFLCGALSMARNFF